MIPVRTALVEVEARARGLREWISRHQPGPPGAFYRAGGNSQLTNGLPLSSDDSVIDAGAYEGGWSDEILCRYGCRMFLFEPIPAFAARLRKKYGSNSRVEIFEAALGGEAGRAQISLQADGSSLYRASSAGGPMVDVVDIAAFLDERLPNGAACLKLNIEGGEYDVLERLLNDGWASKLRVILIQFHRIAADSEERRSRIQRRLAETHSVKFDFPFVWECWIRRP